LTRYLPVRNNVLQLVLIVNTFCITISGYGEIFMSNGPNANQAPRIEDKIQNNEPRINIRVADLPGILVLILIVAVLIIAAFARGFFPDNPQAGIKFASDAIFSLLALTVIIIQAVIYAQQAIFMKQQAETLDKQREASVQLAETAFKQFEITDRPWLAFDAEVTSPLTFNEQNMQLGFKLSAKNVGRSVAVNATIKSKIVIPRLGADCNIWGEVRMAQQSLCQNVQSPLMPCPVFPDEVIYMEQGFALGWPEIERGRLPGTDIMQIYLVGCVDYQFAGHDAHHQTGFGCEIRGAERIGEDVPLEHLKLMRMFMGGCDYAT
jgi:hypothetical protein